MSFDESLIRRLHPVLDAARPAPGEPVHAEVLHQLCLTDGLLELLDWSSQSTAADPLACMWLGSLRWHRLMTGGFPQGAPEPPPRDADRLLAPAFFPGAPGRRSLAEGSGSSSLTGLASGEMGRPGSPNQPERGDAGALLRVVPIGLTPYVEEEMRFSWAEQAVCLTHGAAPLRERARRLAALVAQAAASAPRPQHRDSAEEETPQCLAEHLAAELEEILQDADALTSVVLRRQLAAAAGTAPHSAQQDDVAAQDKSETMRAAGSAAAAEAAGSALAAAVERLTREWERITSPRQ